MNEKLIWMLENGFSEEEDLYIVYGGNTYKIKEELKEKGYKFSPLFGWHSSSNIPISAPYKILHLTFNELYKWEDKFHKAFPIENIKTIINQKIVNEYKKTIHSNFIGELKERIIILVQCYNIKYIKNKYPYYIYYFKDNQNNRLFWKTQTKLEIQYNKKYNLTGTIVGYHEFYNIKYTELKRCILK